MVVITSKWVPKINDTSLGEFVLKDELKGRVPGATVSAA